MILLPIFVSDHKASKTTPVMRGKAIANNDPINRLMPAAKNCAGITLYDVIVV